MVCAFPKFWVTDRLCILVLRNKTLGSVHICKSIHLKVYKNVRVNTHTRNTHINLASSLTPVDRATSVRACVV